MSILKEILGYAKDVMVLTDRIESITAQNTRMAEHIRDLECRLIRIEALIEYATQRRLPQTPTQSPTHPESPDDPPLLPFT